MTMRRWLINQSNWGWWCKIKGEKLRCRPPATLPHRAMLTGLSLSCFLLVDTCILNNNKNQQEVGERERKNNNKMKTSKRAPLGGGKRRMKRHFQKGNHHKELKVTQQGADWYYYLLLSRHSLVVISRLVSSSPSHIFLYCTLYYHLRHYNICLPTTHSIYTTLPQGEYLVCASQGCCNASAAVGRLAGSTCNNMPRKSNIPASASGTRLLKQLFFGFKNSI